MLRRAVTGSSTSSLLVLSGSGRAAPLVASAVCLTTSANQAPVLAVSSSLAVASASHTRVSRTRGYSTAFPKHVPVTMPALSPTMKEGTVVEWSVKVGDKVSVGDLLCSIQTDKAVLDLNAPEEGFIGKLLVGNGTTSIPVNQLIAVIVDSKDDVAKFASFVAPIGGGGGGSASSSPAAVTASAVTATSSAPSASSSSAGAAAPAASGAGPSFVPASPLARSMAAASGVPLNAVFPGSGYNSRVVASDVAAYTPSAKTAQASAPAAPVAVASAAGGALDAAFTDIKTSPIRAVIAQRLTESKTTVPHYYLSADIRVDAVLQLRKEFNSVPGATYKLSVNDFVIKAAALALKKVPTLNSHWHGSFIRQYNTADISIAVDTPSGLITPIVTGAESRGLVSISTAVKELATRAKASQLLPHEFQGGTFTISNLGMFGVKSFSAIINPPQSCILAVGATEERVIVDATASSGFATASIMNVTVSCDHRVVDGAKGAQWLSVFKGLLENPSSMLL